MAYSTIQKIRDEAGFSTNGNITDPQITTYQAQATARVQSVIASRYLLSTLSGSTFTGSQAAALLDLCEMLLAAGALLSKEYQGQQMGTNEGKEKTDRGLKILDDIQSGAVRLLDSSGLEFTGMASTAASGPIAQTNPIGENQDPTVSERKFSVDDIY